MKMQSTLEFIMILTIISLFSIFVISQYIPIQNVQKSAFNRLSNQLMYNSVNSLKPVQTYNNTNLNITAFLPNITYVNKDNNINLIFSYPGFYKIDSIKLNSINATIYPNNFSNINSSYIRLIQSNLIPKTTGLVYVNISIVAFIENSTHKYNLILSSFARNLIQNTSNNTNKTIALINNRNESILIYPSKAMQISNINEWHHCPYIGDWGNVLPEYRQCGYNTYGFMIYSGACNSGAYTMYICIKFDDSNIYLQNLSNQYSYLYKINLNTNINNINASTTLSNNYDSNQLMDNNVIVGVAKINSINAFNPSLKNYSIENESNNKYIVNSTYYNDYLNITSKLESTLVQANGTYIASGLYNYINNLVGSTNYYSSQITYEQPIQIDGCILSNDQLICKSNYPFLYNITAKIFNQSINKTVDYEGSIIYII